MIVTSRSNTDTGKEGIILEQLEELKLKDHTHVFYKNAEDSDDETKEIVLITITVPDEILNEEAEKMEIETTLSFSFTNVFVTEPEKKINFKMAGHPHWQKRGT